MKKLLLAALFSGALFAAPIDIRIDVSDQVSTTPGNWNNIGDLAGTTNNLIDFTTGLGSGVSITGDSAWRPFFGDDGGAFPNQDWLIQPATLDAAGLDPNGSASFTLSGLADGSYTVELVSARTSFNYLNTFSVNGAGASRTYLGTPVVAPWGATVDGLQPGNWLIWDNVVPVNGIISIDLSTGDTLGILNAMRLSGGAPSAIPEPASLGLAAAGLSVLLLLRRRKA